MADWRVLPQLKDKYVESVFNKLEIGFPMSEASDHFITRIERLWFLKINEDTAVDMIVLNKNEFNDLNALIEISQSEGNEKRFNEQFSKIKGFNK